MDLTVLLSGVAGKDSRAWWNLLRELGRLARAAARRNRLSDAERRDLVQTVALLVLEGLPVRDPERSWGWLVTTLDRQARRIRARAERTLRLPDRAALAGESSPRFRGPETATLAAERDRALWLLTTRLSSARARRLVWLLAHRPDLSQAELAAELGVAVGSIGPLRRRSLDTLRNHLLAAGYGPTDLTL